MLPTAPSLEFRHIHKALKLLTCIATAFSANCLTCRRGRCTERGDTGSPSSGAMEMMGACFRCIASTKSPHQTTRFHGQGNEGFDALNFEAKLWAKGSGCCALGRHRASKSIQISAEDVTTQFLNRPSCKLSWQQSKLGLSNSQRCQLPLPNSPALQMGYWVQVETIHGLPRAIKSKYHVWAPAIRDQTLFTLPWPNAGTVQLNKAGRAYSSVAFQRFKVAFATQCSRLFRGRLKRCAESIRSAW